MDNYQKNEKDHSYWKEVGARFADLGETLGRAVQSSIDDPRTQEVLEQIKNGLNQAADEIEGAIKTAKEDPKVQQFTDEATEAFNNLGELGEETVQQVKPQVIKALKSFTNAISSLLDDIENEKKS
jgi:NAD/NADP transhydrogenase alpha subunit